MSCAGRIRAGAAQRIVHELVRGPAPEPLPSRATVHRILVRHGLVVARARRRKRSGYVRWQRPAAMQLWQLDQAPLPATRSVPGRLMTSDDTGTACQSDAGR